MREVSYVCSGCFGAKRLKRYVHEHGAVGDRCDYCRRVGRPRVEVGELTDLFTNFMELFEENQAGLDQLAFYLEGHGIFSARLTERKRNGLFEDIVNANYDHDDGQPPISAADYYRYRSSFYDEWNEFAREARDSEDAELAFPEEFQCDVNLRSETLTAGTVFFRARLGCQRGPGWEVRPYEGDGIGPPPAERNRPGRAHVPPKRVLYLAEQELTAVAEVRPTRGRYVSVCRARLRQDLRVLDLAKSAVPASAFFDGGFAVNVEATFQAIGEAMGEPQRFDDDPGEYRACQSFAEFAEMGCQLDGLRYPSVLSRKGTNLVVFDPAKIEILESRLVEVTALRMWYREFPTPR